MTIEAPIHSSVEPIAFLLGTWRGEGKGSYPTIDPFGYLEEVHFWHIGKPFLAYSQRTWSPDDKPLHSEMGFWRPREGGFIEVVLAHPSGVVEIDEGRVEGTRIEVESTSVEVTSTAKRVNGLARTLEVTGDVLAYTLEMSAVGESLQRHLAATLRRI